MRGESEKNEKERRLRTRERGARVNSSFVTWFDDDDNDYDTKRCCDSLPFSRYTSVLRNVRARASEGSRCSRFSVFSFVAAREDSKRMTRALVEHSSNGPRSTRRRLHYIHTAASFSKRASPTLSLDIILHIISERANVFSFGIDIPRSPKSYYND